MRIGPANAKTGLDHYDRNVDPAEYTVIYIKYVLEDINMNTAMQMMN
jgi:hypothetical protein